MKECKWKRLRFVSSWEPKSLRVPGSLSADCPGLKSETMMKVSVKCTSTKWLVPTGAQSISVSDEKCQCQPVSMLVRSVVRPSTPLEKSPLLFFVKTQKKTAYCPEGNPWYPQNFMVYLLFKKYITSFPQISWCTKGWCRSSCRCGRNFDVLGYGFTSIVGSSQKMDVFENGMFFSAFSWPFIRRACM